MSDITVVTPTFPKRQAVGHLERCIESVNAQTVPAAAHVIHNDTVGVGAAKSRQAAFTQVRTEWTAFLDDDDWLEPRHLELLADKAEETGADLVYPAMFCTADWDVLDPYHFRDFDAELERVLRAGDLATGVQNFIPITVLVRTELVAQVGGIPDPYLQETKYFAPCAGEDHMLWIRLLDAGAKFAHLPIRTWTYNHHQGDGASNTSGRPWKVVHG